MLNILRGTDFWRNHSLSLHPRKSHDDEESNDIHAAPDADDRLGSEERVEAANQSIATVRIPANAATNTIHLICEVHDNGPFRLVAYRRIMIAIKR